MIFALLFVFSAIAAKPIPKIAIQVKGHYKTVETYIFDTGGQWGCKMELLPYVEVSKQPFDVKLLEILRTYWAGKKPYPGCRDYVTIVDRTQKQVATIYGCREFSPFEDFLGEIDQKCGRVFGEGKTKKNNF